MAAAPLPGQELAASDGKEQGTGAHDPGHLRNLSEPRYHPASFWGGGDGIQRLAFLPEQKLLPGKPGGAISAVFSLESGSSARARAVARAREGGPTAALAVGIGNVVAGLRSPAPRPRRAPPAREPELAPRALPGRLPRRALPALPRPGAGGAWPASRSPAGAPGSASAGVPAPSAGCWGGGGGPAAPRGGARWAALGAGLRAVPTPTRGALRR